MSCSKRRSFQTESNTIRAIKNTALEKIIENIRAMAHIQCNQEMDPKAADTTTQTELTGVDIENEKDLRLRSIIVAENLCQQKEKLLNKIQKLKEKVGRLKKKTEKYDNKNEDLALRNISLTNTLHEFKIKCERMLKTEKELGPNTGSQPKVKGEKWKKCTQPGCDFQEPLSNNNMSRHYKRNHPNILYNSSCYKKFKL